MTLCKSLSLITRHIPPLHGAFYPRHSRFSTTLSAEPAHSSRVSLAESLQSETLKILEWPAVCTQLSAFTSTSMAREAAQSGRIPVGQSPEESEKLLSQTSAAVAVARALDFSEIEDVSSIVDANVAGQLLSIRELCSVKRTLKSARLLYEQLLEIASDNDLFVRCSPLLEIFQNCNFLEELEQKIEYCINCNLSIILDRASEDLELIRSERKRNMETLETLLKNLSLQIFQAGGIEKPLVTKRRSRMCIAVKASHRYLLSDGVVLNTSSSGATYFMEPKEAVELNNMEVRLSNSEKTEEQIILSWLASEIANSSVAIGYLLDRVMQMDLAFARAAHANWMNAVRPIFVSTVNSDNLNQFSVDIEGIQHPLLLESSREKLSEVATSRRTWGSFPSYGGAANTSPRMVSRALDFPVPIDIKVAHGVKVVVISGPNTGGKTASMKTLGLASVMMKAGMFLPARIHPRIPWFDLILADIGDHQSLEQSLSTFSGHISRICKILKVASENSLVLLDEIGSGTDPSEGVALSASILQYLKDRVNLAVVTTHYADLTLLKEQDCRFENVAMEFSLETLKPTYRIIWGSTGESNALSIAKSIGFDGKIIERAQSWTQKLAPEKMQKQKTLLYQSLSEERNKLEIQAKAAESLRIEIQKLYHEIWDEAEDLVTREAASKAKETYQIQQELGVLKTEIEAAIQQFESQLETTDPSQVNALLRKAEATVASIVERQRPADGFPDTDSGSKFYTPKLGEQVHVKSLGYKLSTVIEAPGDDNTVLVQYGKMRVRVHLDSIKAGEVKMNSRGSPMPRTKTSGQRIGNLKNLGSLARDNNNLEVDYGPVVQMSKNTIDLRGMRVEEASLHLNMAVDTRSSHSVVFIIHGMGTGAVKECVYRILKDHPRVEKFDQESPLNPGCTVAYIN